MPVGVGIALLLFAALLHDDLTGTLDVYMLNVPPRHPPAVGAGEHRSTPSLDAPRRHFYFSTAGLRELPGCRRLLPCKLAMLSITCCQCATQPTFCQCGATCALLSHRATSQTVSHPDPKTKDGILNVSDQCADLKS